MRRVCGAAVPWPRGRGGGVAAAAPRPRTPLKIAAACPSLENFQTFSNVSDVSDVSDVSNVFALRAFSNVFERWIWPEILG